MDWQSVKNEHKKEKELSIFQSPFLQKAIIYSISSIYITVYLYIIVYHLWEVVRIVKITIPAFGLAESEELPSGEKEKK